MKPSETEKVSSQLERWLKSMGAKGLVLKKAFLCVEQAISSHRSSLAWWEARSGVKRGFLRNGLIRRYMEGIDLAGYAMSSVAAPVIPVIVDYTHIDPLDEYRWRKVLVAAIQTTKGRAIPVEADVLTSRDIEGAEEDSENRFEKRFLMRLLEKAKSLLKRLLIIGDRGFADGKLFTFMKKKGMSFVIRVPCNVEIELPNGEWMALRELLPEPSDQVIFLEKVRYSREHGVRLNVVAFWKKGCNEPWFIATSLSSAEEAIAYYRMRFTVEETFKSAKTYENLGGLKARNKAVLRGMTKSILLACAFLILVGTAIEHLVVALIPSIKGYEDRYSIFTKALACLDPPDRLRCAPNLLCPKNLRVTLNQALFLGGGSM